MHDIQDVTILLVEDDPGHTRLIEKNLRRANIKNEIAFATNGQEALDYLFCEGAFTNNHRICWYSLTSTCRYSTAIRYSNA
jgi:hypothetical protein